MQPIDTGFVTFGRRVAQVAAERPDDDAIIIVSADGGETPITWSELDLDSNRMARLLASRGVDENTFVVVTLPACLEHFSVIIGAWRLGAAVLPLNASLPAAELTQMLDVASRWRKTVIVGDITPPHAPLLSRTELAARAGLSAEPLPDVVAQIGRGLASGGSTGRPKLILDPKPWLKKPGGNLKKVYGVDETTTSVITTRLYHAIGFNLWTNLLVEGGRVIVMERFNPAQLVDLIEKHRVSFLGLVPTIMKRVLQVPNVRERDFSSINAMYHSGGPCPPWLKRAWMELVPPDRVYDLYGGAEGTGLTSIRGDQWLMHPGSVGRGVDCVIRIQDDQGRELPVGEIGEVFLKRFDWPAPSYRYLGADPAPATEDGFITIGDLGWLDDEGYLYLADRRTDLIISGDANVYPAEVEAALSEHPEVEDVAVVGRADPTWGKRVHAVIQPRNPARPPAKEELDQFARARLQAYKVPRSYEFVPLLPRDENGKIRRSALADPQDERTGQPMER